jgi:hypothetical protein
MRRYNPRPLLALLLLTLAAPAPRMAAWLLSSSARDYTSARQEPPAHGRNRIPSSPNSTRDFAGTRLGSGRPPRRQLAEFGRLAPSRRTLAASGGIIIVAPTPGLTPLRC